MGLIWLAVGVAIGVVAARMFATRTQPVPITDRPPTRPVDDTVDDPTVARLRQALDALNLGVVVSDADGRIVVRNRSAGTTGALHTDALVREAIDTLLATARAGGEGRRVLELFGPPARVVVVSTSPLGDGGAVATVEDVTERSRLDTVRTDFVANVSHELKTPVGAIAVLAEALLDEFDLEVVHRFAGKMVAEAHRMGTTIDDLLELSRIELGGEMVRQPVDIRRVIGEAVERVESEAGRRRISLGVDCDAVATLTVKGDARQLVSAVGNLVENAVKYSDDGATVSVAATRDGDVLRITVSDTGVGIPARDLDRVFERFYRVDRARSRGTGGTGLGLAIVRHVATNHGGTVDVVSREGEGSTFTLTIPGVSS